MNQSGDNFDFYTRLMSSFNSNAKVKPRLRPKTFEKNFLRKKCAKFDMPYFNCHKNGIKMAETYFSQTCLFQMMIYLTESCSVSLEKDCFAFVIFLLKIHVYQNYL